MDAWTSSDATNWTLNISIFDVVFYFLHNGNKWPCCCLVRFRVFFVPPVLHPWFSESRPWRDPDPGGGLVRWWKRMQANGSRLRLDCVEIVSLFHSRTRRDNSKKPRNYLEWESRLFSGGSGGWIQLMLELFIVPEWVTSCQPAPSFMLACLFYFFFFLKNVRPHPNTAALKREQKTRVRVLLDTMNFFLTVSSKQREGKPAEPFHLKWLFIARLKREEAAGEVKGSVSNTLDLCFDQRFSRRPVDVSQVPPARCTGSHPCTWSGLQTASCDASTGPCPAITLCLKLAIA